MAEVDEASKIISAAADPDANIIFGATVDESIHDQIRITLIATGFDETRKRLQSIAAMDDRRPTYSSPFTTSPAMQSVQNNSQQQQTEELKKEENEEDIFDIPAFLRQRN